MYSSTLEINVDSLLGEKKQEETSQSEGPVDTLNMYKQTHHIVNKTMTHRFTSSAFVLSPFAGSPLHLNQNFNSSFLSSDGFRPNNKALGISSSVRLESHISTLVAMLNVRLFTLALLALLAAMDECPFLPGVCWNALMWLRSS